MKSMWDEAVVAYYKVIFLVSSEWTKERHKKRPSGYPMSCPGLEYKSDAFMSE
jgi:hypothetical protein